MVLEQCKLNILILLLSGINKTWEITVVRLTAQKTNVGVHSDVYESIWFKLGMMIDIIKLYILILI